MRICSLLPSITEVLYALGLGDRVVGVTHECDWPPDANLKPQLTRSRIRTADRTGAEIDAAVKSQAGSLYDLDVVRLAELAPDLILTQSLCRVCAVDESLVRSVAASLPGTPQVRSYHPLCLSDIWAMVRDIGEAAGLEAVADRLLNVWLAELARVRAKAAALPERPRVVCLEWIDPPFHCGHWTPELIEIAGGRECLGRTGQMSCQIAVHELMAADPEILVVSPCGMGLDAAVAEFRRFTGPAGWEQVAAVRTGRVYGCDGSAYFNRPGPRLIDTAQILAELIHPSVFGGSAPPGSFQCLAVR